MILHKQLVERAAANKLDMLLIPVLNCLNELASCYVHAFPPTSVDWDCLSSFFFVSFEPIAASQGKASLCLNYRKGRTKTMS